MSMLTIFVSLLTDSCAGGTAMPPIAPLTRAASLVAAFVTGSASLTACSLPAGSSAEGSPAVLEAQLRGRLPAGPLQILARAEGRVLVGVPRPATEHPETDARPPSSIAVWDAERDDVRVLADAALDAAFHPRGWLIVRPDGALLRQPDERRAPVETLLTGVIPGLAVLEDGAVVATRRAHSPSGEPTDAPDDTDLWLLSPDGEARVLVSGDGPDEQPFVLPGKRVGFVSGRTGVASLWTVDLETGQLLQLTNRGQRPGRLDERFVPPPQGDIEVVGDTLRYRARPGQLAVVSLLGDDARLLAESAEVLP